MRRKVIFQLGRPAEEHGGNPVSFGRIDILLNIVNEQAFFSIATRCRDRLLVDAIVRFASADFVGQYKFIKQAGKVIPGLDVFEMILVDVREQDHAVSSGFDPGRESFHVWLGPEDIARSPDHLLHVELAAKADFHLTEQFLPCQLSGLITHLKAAAEQHAEDIMG